ncbi:MAG: DUF86 domain-containing protein [Planctomycetia bacterium]
MSFAPHDYPRHILDECDFLLDTAAGVTAEAFLADKTLRRAFQRSLEVIGEASKQLSGDFRSTHPDLPWREMAAMRDRLIHGYFGVDDAIVWDVVQSHIPLVRAAVLEILTGYDDG